MSRDYSMNPVDGQIYCALMGDVITYIGSSAIPLQQVEDNHRLCVEKGFKQTAFRRFLINNQESIRFRTLEQLHVPIPVLELIEQEYIGYHNPVHNIDKTPFKTSCATQRITKDDIPKAKAMYNSLNRDFIVE